MQYVDYHCHLDLYPNHEQLLKESQKNSIATLTVTTTPKAWEKNVEMAKPYSLVRVALGLHPQLVSQRANEITLFEKFLPLSRFVGEIGLDAGRKFYHSFNEQQKVFNSILSMSSHYQDKILSVHSAYTSKKVLDSLETYFFPNDGKVVLHWFSGSQRELDRAIEMGCYFSINSQMLINQKNVNVLTKIPISRVLTETDGPFTQIQGKPSRPTSVKLLIHDLAKLFNRTSQQLQQQILNNLLSLESNSNHKLHL